MSRMIDKARPTLRYLVTTPSSHAEPRYPPTTCSRPPSHVTFMHFTACAASTPGAPLSFVTELSPLASVCAPWHARRPPYLLIT